jgi:hypothetical protein
MTTAKHDDQSSNCPATKAPWQTPDFEVLSTTQTANNGLVAPGDGTYSPSPTGS